MGTVTGMLKYILYPTAKWCRVRIGTPFYFFLIVGIGGVFGPTGFIHAQRPNILFVFIDDMGYGDLGCYGNSEVNTPNIDRLANEGIRFTQFYVNSPICSPSRTAVVTGQYPSRWGITSYIDSRARN